MTSRRIHLIIQPAFVLIGLLLGATPSQGQSWLTNGLVAYYPLAGSSVDVLGRGNTGTLYNNAYYTNGLLGKASTAVYCDGVNAYVLFGKNDALYPNQTFTWSLWFKTEQTNTMGQVLFWDDDYQIGNDRFIAVNPNKTLTYYSGSSVIQQMVSSNTISLGIWHQAVLTSSTLGRFLYLDSAMVASTNTITDNHAGMSSISIGAGNCNCGGPNYAYSGRFRGAISTVRIYNRALSAKEVASLYYYESQKQVQLIKYYNLDFDGLLLGRNYQLQASTNLLVWTNWGTPFTATSDTYTNTIPYQRVEDWSKVFFRLQQQ